MYPADALPSDYFVGPLFTLACLLISVAASAFFGMNIGETSCRYRLDYSPHGRAFGIWSIIYTGCVVVCIVEMTGTIPVLSRSVFLWWGACWLCCGLWVPLFDDRSLWLLGGALVAIGSGAFTASVGAAVAEAWVPVDSASGRTLSVAPALVWPLSLLAGWLITATSLNVGILLKAADPNSDKTCVRVPPQKPTESDRQFRAKRRALIREAEASAPAVVAFEVWVVAFLVAVVTMVARDPVLALPAVWAIVNMKAWPCWEYGYAVLVCALGAAGAAAAAWA
jgi:hypothetical protein